MKGLLYLAVRYMLFHRWRTIVLILGLTLTLFLPTSIHFLVDNFERSLWARSDRTPMVVGAKGSRFDLVLHALYFRAKTPELISMAAMQDIAASGFGSAFPIYATFRARGVRNLASVEELVTQLQVLVNQGPEAGQEE